MSSKTKFHVAVGQMNSVDDVGKNLAQIESLIEQIKNPETVDLVSFPENSLYMRVREGEKISGLTLEDPAFARLSEIARDRKLNLHLGSVALRSSPQSKLQNASVFVNSEGQVRCSYVKIHLFDISLPGHPPVRESDVYDRGAKPEVIEVAGWNLGQSICYDMRFAELYSHYADLGVEIILAPSSFLVPTGKVHWEILLRARAIESQSYVIAAAQAGVHKSAQVAGAERFTYGHSLVIDPWGKVLAEGKAEGPELLQVELSLETLRQVRTQMPMSQHRRLRS
jgi:predicted amidohydrolase